MLNLLDDDVEMKIFDEDFGLYIFKVRECIMKLIFFNVVIKNILLVIESVLKLGNKVVNKLLLR